MTSTEVMSEKGQHNHADHEHRLVTVTIDGRDVRLEAATYRIPDLKARLGVPLDYDLDLIRGDHFEPLGDEQSYKVHGHEAFLSHVRTGSSS